MPKTETTSKMSLKLTSRINLGRWGARGLSFRLWTQPTRPIPTAWKGLNPTRRCNTDVKSCAHHPYHCLPPQNERFAPLSIVKNIDNKLLDYMICSQHKFISLAILRPMLILTYPLSTQPSILRYHSRDLKSHIFRLPIFSSAKLLIFTTLYNDIF